MMKKKFLALLTASCMLFSLCGTSMGNVTASAASTAIQSESMPDESQMKEAMRWFTLMDMIYGNGEKIYENAAQLPDELEYSMTKSIFKMYPGGTFAEVSYSEFCEKVSSLFADSRDWHAYLTETGEYDADTDTVTFIAPGGGGDPRHCDYLYSVREDNLFQLYGVWVDIAEEPESDWEEGYDYLMDNGTCWEILGYTVLTLDSSEGGYFGGKIAAYENIDKDSIQGYDSSERYLCAADGIYQPVSVTCSKGITYEGQGIVSLDGREGSWVRCGEPFKLKTTMTDSNYEFGSASIIGVNDLNDEGNGIFSYTPELKRGWFTSLDIRLYTSAKYTVSNGILKFMDTTLDDKYLISFQCGEGVTFAGMIFGSGGDSTEVYNGTTLEYYLRPGYPSTFMFQYPGSDHPSSITDDGGYDMWLEPAEAGTITRCDGRRMPNMASIDLHAPATLHVAKRVQGCDITGKHTYGEYTVTKEATVLTTGSKTRVCSVCGHKDTVTISKLAATAKTNASVLPLKVKQSTTQWKITGLGKGDKIISYKSSNPKIAAVNKKGKITARRKGKATITATLASGRKVSVKVKVQKNKVTTTKITLNAKNVTLKKGKAYRLTATIKPITSTQKITYSSSKKSVAAVNSSGKITAKKKGKATITVRSGGKKSTCRVTVK